MIATIISNSYCCLLNTESLFYEQPQNNYIWLSFILYIFYFKMNNLLSTVCARVFCLEKLFQGPLRNTKTNGHISRASYIHSFPEDIHSRQLLAKALFSNSLLETEVGTNQISSLRRGL